jgi:hypothetical protein
MLVSFIEARLGLPLGGSGGVAGSVRHFAISPEFVGTDRPSGAATNWVRWPKAAPKPIPMEVPIASLLVSQLFDIFTIGIALEEIEVHFLGSLVPGREQPRNKSSSYLAVLRGHLNGLIA